MRIQFMGASGKAVMVVLNNFNLGALGGDTTLDFMRLLLTKPTLFVDPIVSVTSAEIVSRVPIAIPHE